LERPVSVFKTPTYEVGQSLRKIVVCRTLYRQIKVDGVNVKIIATFCYSKLSRQPQYRDWEQYSTGLRTVQGQSADLQCPGPGHRRVTSMCCAVLCAADEM